jgi:hypothetical protein
MRGLLFGALLLALPFLFFANVQSSTLSVGGSFRAGDYTFTLKDLSASLAAFEVKKGSQMICAAYDPECAVAIGGSSQGLSIESRTGFRVSVLSVDLANRKANIKWESTGATPSPIVISSQQASAIFSNLYSRFPAKSVVVGAGKCRKSSGECFVVSGFQWLERKWKDRTLTYLDAVILYLKKNGSVDDALQIR